MDIDLSTLLVFRHLANSGNFTETAKHWKISQPAVSLMISRLESDAGLILFERSSAGTRLTSSGIQFLEKASDVCDAYLTFIDDMRHIGRRMAREVIVAIDSSYFGDILRNKFSESNFPQGVSVVPCSLRMNWGESLESLQYDVVISGRFLRSGLSPGIQEAAIRKERGITIAWNPSFYKFDTLEFSFPQILRTSVLIPDHGVVTGFSNYLAAWCEQAYGMQPVNAVHFNTEQDAAQAACAGLGVMVAPGDAMLRLGSTFKELVHVKTFEFLLPEAFTFGIYCRSDESSKEVMAVAATLGKLCAKLFS